MSPRAKRAFAFAAGFLVLSCLCCTVVSTLLIFNLGGSNNQATNTKIEAASSNAQQTAVKVDFGSNTGNATNPSCAGVPTARLTSGGRGMVSNTPDHTPTRLRETPGGKILGSYPDGTPFSVLQDAPVCSGGYLWWHIRLDSGPTGWSAEGNAQKYFLEPSK